MPLDQDSIKCLDQVKKGKPVRFVMVNKGMKVISVVAYRKGNLDARKREAREAGMGEVSFGVIDGGGANIVFKLAAADGFTDVPIKNPVPLREFLNDGSGFSFKPTMELVQELPAVEMEDDGQPPPPPRMPPLPPVPPPRRENTYRLPKDWDAVVEQINQAPDPQTKTQRLTQAITELKAERERAQSDNMLAGNPLARQDVENAFRYAAEELKALAPRQTAPQPPTTPPPPVPNQNQPTQNQPPPPRPKIDPALQQKLQDRRARAEHAKQRVTELNTVENRVIYKTADRDRILQECETDLNDPGSQFAKIMALTNRNVFAMQGGYEEVLLNYQTMKDLSEQYIRSHKDPKLGKLPKRVLARRRYCEEILAKCNDALADMERRNKEAKTLCETTVRLWQGGNLPPREVADELFKLKANNLISPEIKKFAVATSEHIARENKKTGYAELGQLDKPTDVEKAQMLNRYGCYKGALGGTSDVKLLQDQDGKISFAFKSLQGESDSALNRLGKPPSGACGVREDLSSALNEEIKKSTGIDFGFPKSQLVSLDGTPGALIEGIPGKTCDPEEIYELTSNGHRLRVGAEQAERDIDELKQKCEDIPDTLSKDSLENVVLTAVFSGQWDCKWGNMMIQGDKARPIDGGTAFPTRAMVQWLKEEGGPTPLAIVSYPDRNSKQHQPIDKCTQPMDTEKAKALLKMDADAIVAAAKARRDKLLQDNPNLTPTMVPDECFDIIKDSIKASQKILRDNPGISIVDFSNKYTEWFMAWA